MMNLLINEMVKLNLITQTGESSLTEKLKQIRLEKLESSNDSGIAMIYSSYGFIDEIISSLGQVCLDDNIPLFLYCWFYRFVLINRVINLLLDALYLLPVY